MDEGAAVGEERMCDEEVFLLIGGVSCSLKEYTSSLVI